MSPFFLSRNFDWEGVLQRIFSFSRRTFLVSPRLLSSKVPVIFHERESFDPMSVVYASRFAAHFGMAHPLIPLVSKRDVRFVIPLLRPSLRTGAEV